MKGECAQRQSVCKDILGAAGSLGEKCRVGIRQWKQYLGGELSPDISRGLGCAGLCVSDMEYVEIRGTASGPAFKAIASRS